MRGLNKAAKVPGAHENCEVALGLGNRPRKSRLHARGSFPDTHGQAWQATRKRMSPCLPENPGRLNQGPRETIGAWEQARAPFPALPVLTGIKMTGYI